MTDGSPFWNADFDSLSMSHLEWLQKMQIEEGLKLDYKKEVGKKEDILRDLVSLSNARGGHLIYGVIGEPKIVAIEGIREAGKYERWIMQWAHNHIKPAIMGMRTKTISVKSGYDVLLTYIPISPNRPHMVDLKDGYQSFYVRREDHNFPMTIDEIRAAVKESISAMQTVREYLKQRMDNIRTSLGPENSCLFLSATPHFIEEEKIASFFSAETKSFLDSLPSPISDLLFPSQPWMPTLEGIRKEARNRGHLIDIHHNGHSEYSATYFFDSRMIIEGYRDLRHLPGSKINSIIFQFLEFARKYLHFFRIYDSVVVTVSLFYVWNSFLSMSSNPSDIKDLLFEGKRIWHPQFLEPEPVRLDNEFNVLEAYHRLADRIWNAFGYEDAPEP